MLHGDVILRKYLHRRRWHRLRPIEAMFRSCGEAPRCRGDLSCLRVSLPVPAVRACAPFAAAMAGYVKGRLPLAPVGHVEAGWLC